MRHLFWTPEALRDREAIYDHVEGDDPQAAIALDGLFAERAGTLVAHPGIGRLGRVDGTRELVVHRRYILVYEQVDAAVTILRVLHTARRWPS